LDYSGYFFDFLVKEILKNYKIKSKFPKPTLNIDDKNNKAFTPSTKNRLIQSCLKVHSNKKYKY